jgi:hypothetical protein
VATRKTNVNASVQLDSQVLIVRLQLNVESDIITYLVAMEAHQLEPGVTVNASVNLASTETDVNFVMAAQLDQWELTV